MSYNKPGQMPSDEQLLLKIVEKTLVFLFNYNLFRQFDKLGLSRRMIQVCEGTGRRGNWFSRTLNQVEDMRISSLLKLTASAERLASQSHDWWGELLTEEIRQWAAVAIDISGEGVKAVLEDPNVLTRLKQYVPILRKRNAITEDEAMRFQLLAAEYDR